MKGLKIAWIITMVFGFIFMICSVSALPSGVGAITPISSGRMSISSAQNQSALAGNVSEVVMTGNTITQTWQGYYGNVSGKMILGDANNNTFYDWSAASAHGEIYATRSATTPVWTNIRCANPANITAEDTYLGTNQSTDPDSVNNTFLNTTNFNQFYVGSVNINTSQNCFATRMYNQSGLKSTSSWAEVLLSDTTNNIYTSILESKVTGFDNRNHDFQMLVGENGHGTDTATTTYYFYLELG